jgi:hypothetical protein
MLYRQYQSQISRRDLDVLTENIRRELLQQHQAELRHLNWQVPGLVWSLDDAELARCDDHQLHLHQVQDLASRYKFTPLVGGQVLGETVALHLELSQAIYWLNPERQGRTRRGDNRWFWKTSRRMGGRTWFIAVGARDHPKTPETHQVLAGEGRAAGAQDLL